MYVQLNICHPKHAPLASAVAHPSLSVDLSNCGGCRYSNSQAFKAILLWPFLALFSQSFRQEIREASLRQQNHMVSVVSCAHMGNDCYIFLHTAAHFLLPC